MAQTLYWLIDASYADESVQLSYYSTPANKLELTREPFQPYFFALPVNLGKAVRRTELMSGQELEIAQVPLSHPVDVVREWERDIDPALSFVYDHNLRFGSPHRKTPQGMQLELHVPEHHKEAFDVLFQKIQQQDSLKFSFLETFFQLAIQPIPNISPELLNLEPSIDEEQIYWGFMLARIANIPLPKAIKTRGVSAWIRSMLHSTYRNLDILIPDPEELKKGHTPHRVEGALTIAPKPGYYFQMTVLDFESLYPSCIDYYNLSYETVDCNHSECHKNQVPNTDHYICTHRRGIFSALLGALKDLRIHWFKPQSRRTDISENECKRAKTVSDMLKLLLVSAGGVTIRIQGLASPPFAESMMAYGRWALQTTWDWAEEQNMRPVYGDTDSLFLDNPNQEQIEWLIQKAQDELGLKLAVDVIYPLCVLSTAKKAYFGILPDDTVDIKGITLGKASTPPLFRRIFLEAVKPLVGVDTEEKLGQARPQVVDILRQHTGLMRKGLFSVEDMEYRVKVWKAERQREKDAALPQAYQALQQLTDKGIRVKRRSEVGFVKVKPFRYRHRTFTVKPTQQAQKEEIDIPDYLRKIEMAFQQVLEPLQIQFPRETGPVLDTFLSTESHQPFTDEVSSPKPHKRKSQKQLTDFSEKNSC
jgi:DNA polymerase elongation subunit (family B)